jgi:hypothetical protein
VRTPDFTGMNSGNGEFRVFTASPLNAPSHMAFVLALTLRSAHQHGNR